MSYIRQIIGKKGEEIAKNYLLQKGYSIIETNFSCFLGEADIIAKTDKEIVFVEVKTRAQEIYGYPSESVTYEKRKHIYNVAEFYICKNKLKDIPVSLDVIEVYMYNGTEHRVEHIKNAILEKPQFVRRRIIE